MKLLYCRKCKDIFPLSIKQECKCKKTRGRYIVASDGRRKVVYTGTYATPLCIGTHSFQVATKVGTRRQFGCEFTAFVAGKGHDFQRVEETEV